MTAKTKYPEGEAGPAVLSHDRRYRYTLTRVWEPQGKRIAYIGLNPSTADERQLDPTLRRCLRFAYDWGFGRFVMVNLFAFRATDPIVMKRALDPVGPDNNTHTGLVCQSVDLVVACWGTHGAFMKRDQEVRRMLRKLGVPLHYLKLSKHGHPGHPLYLSSETKPKEWKS